jgi:hypothetical protein
VNDDTRDLTKALREFRRTMKVPTDDDTRRRIFRRTVERLCVDEEALEEDEEDEVDEDEREG